MPERKLATVETIREIRPIEGADRIEVARVRGWDVVVGKGEFEVGSKVVFFEIDSALPIDDERFSFLADRGTKTMPDGTKVHVLKTIRLRGVYSQGLVIDLSKMFPKLENDVRVGVDLTDVIGISKWEPPLPGVNSTKGNFPTQYANKTDSERVQNIGQRTWGEIQTKGWVATEKVDGSSVSVVLDEAGELIVCSRNYIVGEGSVHHRAVMAADWKDLLVPGMVVQGEVVGPGVNGNRLQLTETRIIIFDVWQDRKLTPRHEWPSWATENAVPVYSLPLPKTQDEAVEQVNGIKSLINPKVQAEGIVWHTSDGSVLNGLGRSTWKAINNRYLLKTE